MGRQGETQLHIAIASHLRWRALPGVLWWHTPNGEARDKRAGARLKAMGTLPGIPDLLLLIDGRLHGLEIKVDGGRLSRDQRGVHAALEGAGAVCATTWDVDSALAILRAWRAIE